MAVSFDTLHWLHLGAAIAHGTQSAYTFVLGNTKYKDQGTFTVTNEFVRPGTVSNTEVGSFRLANMIGVFPALSTLNHLWAFFDRSVYEAYVEQGVNPVRWSEYGISAGIMFVALSMLSGQTDVKALTATGLGNVALQYIGYLVEEQVSLFKQDLIPRHVAASSSQHLEVLGFTIFMALWVPTMTAFFTGVTSSGEEEGDTPDAVWSVIFVMTALLLSFGVLSVLYQRSVAQAHGSVSNFRNVELGYLVLSLVSKSFLTNMVMFGGVNAQPEKKKRVPYTCQTQSFCKSCF